MLPRHTCLIHEAIFVSLACSVALPSHLLCFRSVYSSSDTPAFYSFILKTTRHVWTKPSFIMFKETLLTASLPVFEGDGGLKIKQTKTICYIITESSPELGRRV